MRVDEGLVRGGGKSEECPASALPANCGGACVRRRCRRRTLLPDALERLKRLNAVRLSQEGEVRGRHRQRQYPLRRQRSGESRLTAQTLSRLVTAVSRFQLVSAASAINEGQLRWLTVLAVVS